MLGAACIKQGCDLHAYAFVAHEVRLLITGGARGAVTAALHASAQQFARYANTRDETQGTPWYGRYQSCLVGGREYVLDAYRLIERTAQIALGEGEGHHPAWSSYAGNARGQQIRWLTPHAAYAQLGDSDAERQMRYRELFQRTPDTDVSLVLHTQQGCPWGSDRFLRKLAREMGEVPTPRPRGRPRKIVVVLLKSLSLFS